MNILDDWPRVKAVFEQALAVEGRSNRRFSPRRAEATRSCGSASTRCWRRMPPATRSWRPAPALCSGWGARDLSGHTLGTYRLLSRIGAGAMGEVYAAHDEKLNRRVAVKLIAKDLAGDADGCGDSGRRRTRPRA